ncbi:MULTISPECIES: TraB/GumN family protein [unclassified Brenneria]|uniref:TraB/GumN family protein n=1 Tax=unclassified Brenneria TaxID=2634434 RepID=UPI0015522E4E|nr:MULTISPECIES: TraB/GumN family protein [unclassified Brenneria]MBJ7221770.1 TraB/GumN family protein [Brenneria sp. L3-3C-1]MEE3643011.1 TraB/GumN family protein [Brenneria sp. L3_3C_1]MEE3650802.1 TraB/GumN family protein [Brenneria sp. HEZEL_4_2_4]NPD00757.1 conjugal transfer protein TraB [Brenneria sp. hezel4-2-4]
MGPLLRRIATFLGFISPLAYAYPAVDIQLADRRQFHLVGSIHMGSMDMAPLPDALLKQLKSATALIIEADISDPGSPFEHNETEPPLAQRLSPDNYRQLQQICETLAFSESSIDRLPAWQAALMLQARQAQLLGLRPDYGIDYQLINAAKSQGLHIIELEGQQTQVDLLQQLPHGGLLLLEDTLTHWHANARLLQTMVGWWLDSKPDRLTSALPATFGNEMTDLLMNQRNRRWQQQLQALPAGNYVVAVGALHLYGDDNLPALLQAN